MLLSGRLSGLLLVLLVSLPLSSCGKIPSFLTGGGPNVAANTQIGKTNTQTIGQTNNISPTVSVRPNARVDTVDQSVKTVTNNELPYWVWIAGLLLLITGWVTDTPATYIKRLRGR
jgi:beta-lactamase regulating signal transducer with metallopeptidase domain